MSLDEVAKKFEGVLSGEKIEELKKLARGSVNEEEASYQGLSVDQLSERYFYSLAGKDVGKTF